MIGQVQTNKLKKTLPFIHLLHSLDRMSLVKALRVETAKIAEPITALVELNLTGETAKHGFREDELASVWQEIEAVPNVHVKGFMAMAKLDATTQECRATFAKLREIRDQYARHSRPSHSLDLLSMGMSDDFEVAIEEGATHVRIGSALFEGLPND